MTDLLLPLWIIALGVVGEVVATSVLVWHDYQTRQRARQDFQVKPTPLAPQGHHVPSHGHHGPQK